MSESLLNKHYTPIENRVIQNVISHPPTEKDRNKHEIPFHIPHKKLLEKIEHRKIQAEPLTGYDETQKRFTEITEDHVKKDPSPSERGRTKFQIAESTCEIGGTVDQAELIKLVRTQKQESFYYMVYSLSRSSEHYTPYSLKLVPYSNINKCDFLTISKRGVLQTYGRETIFTPLSKWEYEYVMYCKLRQYKTFLHCRIWKAFYIWRNSIVWRKKERAGKYLEENLFLLNPILGEALLNLEMMCYKFNNVNFTNTTKIENLEFFYFIEDQMEVYESLLVKLTEFRVVVKELVNCACHGALLKYGFTVDDRSFYAQFEGKRRGKFEGEPRMSYMEQAKKRRFCVRLSQFITLIDYIVISLLHSLIWNSVTKLLDAFNMHLKFLPSLELLEGSETDILLEEPRPDDAAKIPMFAVNVMVDTKKLSLDPSAQVFKQILTQVMDMWNVTVTKFELFLSDPYYIPFLRPLINGKIEERICGYGPRLEFYLNNDTALVANFATIFKNISDSFDLAMTFMKRFQYVQTFYTEDYLKTEAEIDNERSLEAWRGMCKRYYFEIDEMEKIPETQYLGLLNLRMNTFKEIVLPEPKKLLAIIDIALPKLGKMKVDELIEDTTNLQEFLESEPQSTIDCVKYIEQIDISPVKLDEMETWLDYSKELYDIMEEFHIAVAPEDMANYLGVSVTLGTLRGIVDKHLEDRQKSVQKFTEACNKDINRLITDIEVIKEECMESWLIDIESVMEDAEAALEALYERIINCQKRANEYKGYQRQFRVEMTRFDFLDEVLNDIKLRMLLWETLNTWHKTIDEWYEVDFTTLDVEEMNNFTAKNLKNVTQLEKGLPKNLIVTQLKEDIATIKDKLPVVGYLRNPALRQRHWMRIEAILNYKFKVEEVLTLTFLENLHCFTYPNEFMDLSAQASSEFSLETMLKKVEETWKSLEFVVLPHRDVKDVYILGPLEDVQQVLDDSFITINTIISSRHVGPIKARVEEWLKMLENFSQTLEEWSLCQSNWIYLEIIFSAPDIQRQLPQESKLFIIVDKSWKDIMRRTVKMPLAMEACSFPGLLDALKRNNGHLDQILKCLEAYLEVKRVAFPRFYFLSNDELLDVLAQTRNPFAVQPHLRKCFDAISKLEFGTRVEGEGEAPAAEGAEAPLIDDTPVMTTDIIAMLSPEGERVPLTKGLKARGNVEDWLRKVEDSMFISLKKGMKRAIEEFMKNKREDWVTQHPSQIILTVSQIMWAKDVHAILDGTKNKHDEMVKFERICNTELNMLAGMTRQDISSIFRKVLVALITISVHARDTITNMVGNSVFRSSDFEWLKMLRYYWVLEIDDCIARMSSAEYIYGYEYLGAAGVLVITPLTDKCYLCLMGALQLDLGGAPAGPAGTGKTETTKDLAKALAIQCVVFNCSEGLDYKMMGRFFSGLAQSGAWCCFDEFNRIDIEVLSVIAQQLITIRNAKAAKLKWFMFEGREIKLVQSCAAFITMNPGYAGRTELPDNLKALFRPMSMMVPDYALIAEVTLYSEGFESSKMLAQKMVQMYKLCSEQLSQQDHYDFGMRAVKSVLVMAGALKRANPDKNEDVVLIRALRDSNLPKFLADDAILFQGILSDLFPGVELPEQDYGILQCAIEECVLGLELQIVPEQILKVIQLFETMIVRWGVMLVGPTGGGKSTVLNILKHSLTKLHEDKVPGQYYQPVITYILNPKSVSLGELYGEVNALTMEWKDGLLGIMVRKSVQCTTEDHQWVICDGPVDAVWIENMNTVLDDNKMLCLANSERIKLTPYVHMLFEVQDLAQASPATVSRTIEGDFEAEPAKMDVLQQSLGQGTFGAHIGGDDALCNSILSRNMIVSRDPKKNDCSKKCGMVYIDAEELKWLPFVNSWLAKLTVKFPNVNPEIVELIILLFETYVENGFTYIRKNCEYSIHQVDIAKMNMMCNLFESIIGQVGGIDKVMDKPVLRCFVTQSFIFSYLWSIGGNLVDISRDKLEGYVRDQFDENVDARLPNDDLWGVYMNIHIKRLESWNKIIPSFFYDKTVPFFEMIVPTVDTIRFGYIMERLCSVDKPVLYTGGTGVGKSVIAKVVLNKLFESGKFVPVTLNFSAQTGSSRTQEMIEIKLEKQKKNVLGAPAGKKMIVFVDDVNMPKLDTYGSQPPIELIRQFLDYGGMYDRDKMFWKEIKDVIITAACAPPGGGRNPLTPRFIRHFAMLCIPPPNEYSLKQIFRCIMRGFLSDFANPVKDLSDNMVAAAVDIYERIAEDLLPTPTKSHYVFNLRDLSKCIQGILQADPGTMLEAPRMLRLFYHECLRVFHDRLINVEDKSYFYILMKEVCNRNFSGPVLLLPEEAIITNPPILLFGDFMVFGCPKEDKVYEEIVDIDRMKIVVQDYLDDFNMSTPKEMRLIFFMDAIEHLTRIARILRAERGNALLVGVGGMGKQSLTKLASHMNAYKCGQIELTRNYDHLSFFEDIRKMYFNAGALNENTVFLFTDTQIVDEEFLEDINNILNSGDVPNLFEADEYEKVITNTRPEAKNFGINEGNRDAIYEFFISRVRTNLHLSLCLSPVGDAFRRRCRMFPSLVNCCTIDWFSKWPEEALLSVAEDSLRELGSPEFVENLGNTCVIIHKSVEDTTVRFYKEMRRYYYTTPSSYLDLLKLYGLMLKTKTNQTSTRKSRIANGLKKLYETNTMIDEMKETLTALKPLLALKSIDVAELMVFLEKEQKKADIVRKVVKKDELAALEKAEESQALADEAQADLAMALPAMESAVKALESLNKNDINELRVFQKPPQLVQFVMEAVCLLLGAKLDWQSAKITLGDTNFLKKLQEYDKDKLTDVMLKKLKPYVDNPRFMPDIVATQSKVCKSMCMWVRAVDTYAKVYRIVEPKKKKQEAAETELRQVMIILEEKQKRLRAVEAHIQNLQDKFEATINEKQALEDGIILTAARLIRAGRLTMALADEQIRWEIGVLAFDKELSNMVGDVLLAAACVAYLGAFTSNYREELTGMWLKTCTNYGIPCSEQFSLIEILADAYEIRIWNTCGLPRDNVSTENAILVTKAERWPLMIDPQDQANMWIRQMEVKNQLQVIKLTDSNFMRILESAIRIGLPVLLEELGELLDPTLEPILLKQTFIQAGRAMIRLGDTDVEYDNNFLFYMTTKLANPHYLPEVCIKVTLVNFTVTPSGLEDQLLAEVVRLERPDLEILRSDLIIRINNDKAQLNSIEEKILKTLFFSEGNILDDEELIETLNESKETSAIIASRLLETEATEKNISIAREKYRSVAIRGSVLYFVVARLADIDPMYQYSLKYFKQIFNLVIDVSEKHPELNCRLEILFEQITLAVYVNVSRGLFERHKLIFSFMLCIDILRQVKEITDGEWNFLLRGPLASKADYPKKPDIPSLSDYMWIASNYIAVTFKAFKGLVNDVLCEIPVTLGDFHQVIKIAAPKKPAGTNWDGKLNEFEKLMLIKCLKEEKLVFAITEFVKTKLGKVFCESPQISLHLLYQDTANNIPLVFVLSTGSDPFGSFQRFAAEMKNTHKIQSISLGQGQGPVAEKLIGIGKLRGDWVFLQNCHLATSWMLSMERIILKMAEDASNLHPEFRLFLSSMPSKTFPVSVLQNSVKVTNEPPKGIRANIKRAFNDMPEEFFEENILGESWRAMIFGICIFHAVVQERKKFGPLGWNIMYEFNDSDRECALNTIGIFCADGYIPWDALEYIAGEITYGGRVTDYWDLRCLKTILQGFFAAPTLAPDYKYSASGIYYCPNFEKIQEYREFIDNLPIIEEPEIFGMHENANIAYQTRETQAIILTVLESQPSLSTSETGKSSDEIVYELSEVVLESIANGISTDEAYPALYKPDRKGRLPSLTTVLMQEVDRFNKLLKLIHLSLDNLQKAIKGFLVMSDSLEQMFTSFLNNQVPKMWAAKAYPSLKPLGSWTQDLILRIDFIRFWVQRGLPISIWLPGFFFPQGFLTGALQTHARKYDLPIDRLKFNFIVTKLCIEQDAIKQYHDENKCDDPALYGNIPVPVDGVNIHGLYLDAARWNEAKMMLEDQRAGEMNPPMPAIVLIPIQVSKPNDTRYICPLYKTSLRAGILSTTGHSTNFVVTVLVPTNKPNSYWILKGTALLTQTND